MTTYNEESIQQLSGLEHIRHRPSGYLVDTGINGTMGVCKELLDNAVDELSIKQTDDGILDVILFVNPDNYETFQLAVVDNGRGIPVGRLIDVFANTMTSGKFDTSAYATSAGSFGVGASVTVALSNWFRAITLNNGNIGDATIRHDCIPNEPMLAENTFGHTGTIVVFEPDVSIFSNIDDFCRTEYAKITEYLIQLSLFGKYRIRFTIRNHNLSEADKNLPPVDFINFIKNIIETTEQFWFDSATYNRESYIEYFFGVSKWDEIIPVRSVNAENTLSVKGDIRISLNNYQFVNNKLTMVNNILFTDQGSFHISMLYTYIKQRMSDLIQDKNIRSYFQEHYRLPVWLVLDIKYVGAVYSGLAKTSFRDMSFKHPYQVLLNSLIPRDTILLMYEKINAHIVTQYNKFSNKDFTPSGSMRGLMSRLNRPTKFVNCSTNNRMDAELFLVEGDSAKSNKGRGSSFQAFYTLGGKPYNGLTSIDRLSDSVNNIKRNHIFQDIIRILNITPGSNDLTNLNFGKIFVMADADTHGYHITDILLGDLYALCPALINNGHVYVTIPPLYSLNIKGREPIYIRDNYELNATLAFAVYYNSLDIGFHTGTQSRNLTREEFVAFSEIVCRIGDELDRLSVEYMIPAVLLEQLSLMTSHLNLRQPDINVIRSYLGCEVRYVESGHLLIISIGSDDIIVPLNQITELIYARILPLYRTFYYGKVRITATTKRSKALVNSPISIAQLYQMFKELDKMFTIKRYKGLGSMPPEDIAKNCVNPNTRKVHQIINIGDLKTVFHMLGDDPTERKRLVLN